MEKHILFMLSRPPYGSSSARESTDAIMAACAFGQKVSILAQGDSLFQFTRDQQSETLQMKNTAAMLSSLPMYGTESFYALTSDMETRHLQEQSFVIPVVTIDNRQMKQLIQDADVVLSY